MGRRSLSKNDSKLKISTGKSKKTQPALKVIGETVGDIQNTQMKSLNVIFVYNGHTWDAHEVLGVKPGASIEDIKIAFEETLKNNEPASHEFFKIALASIFQQIKAQSSFESQSEIENLQNQNSKKLKS